jgi:hypothetical protein
MLYHVCACELDSPGSGSTPVVGSCEHNKKPPDSKEGGKFLNQLTSVLLASEEGNMFHRVHNAYLNATK